MPSGVGKRRIDITQSGLQSHRLSPGTTLEVEGIESHGCQAAEWPEVTRRPFQAELKRILDIPWQAMKQAGTEPLVAAIYGCWQAATIERPAPLRRFFDLAG
jgi:hypothetical protein